MYYALTVRIKHYRFRQLIKDFILVLISYQQSYSRIPMSLIYSLVSRGNDNVLCSFSPNTGNFEQVALTVLKRLNLYKQTAQYTTARYNFYAYIKDNYIFIAMCQTDYELRLAITFLKDIAQRFFNRYPKSKRDSAAAFSLGDFKEILKDRMAFFNNKEAADKLAKLKTQVKDLQQITLQNLDNAIERGANIEILVDKTNVMSQASYDMSQTALKVKRKMWWKNKKLCVALILLVIVLGVVIAWAAGAFSSKS